MTREWMNGDLKTSADCFQFVTRLLVKLQGCGARSAALCRAWLCIDGHHRHAALFTSANAGGAAIHHWVTTRLCDDRYPRHASVLCRHSGRRCCSSPGEAGTIGTR